MAKKVEEPEELKTAEDFKKTPVDEATGEIIKVEKVLPAASKILIGDKLVKLKDTLKTMNKTWGKVPEGGGDPSKVIGVLSDKSFRKISRIPSGVLAFDFCTGGGIPRGRITELYGNESASKTTMALRICGEAQKMGLLPSFIDVEGTTEINWAKRFVDIDNILLSQPETGEEALEIVDGLIRSGSTELIVLDSVAAMVPSVEVDKAFGEQTMALQARLMNLAMRKWVGSITYAYRTHGVLVSIILINQIRMKLGVMYGCLHGDTLVNFVDGRSIRIKDVVDNKIEGEVWSYNEELEKCEPKKIIDWHNNGKIESKEDFLFFQTDDIGVTNNKAIFIVTRNHMIYTREGQRPAESIRVGDEILSGDYSIDGIIRDTYVTVVEKRIINDQEFNLKGKYDISIEDNHNYMVGGDVNGVIVHNSPETIPGGMGMTFAKSLSVKMWRGKEVIDESSKKPTMVDMNLKVVKSKVSPPYISSIYTMMLRDTEFKNMGDVYEEAQIFSLARKYGYMLKEGRDIVLELKSGKINTGISKQDEMPDYLLRHPEITAELKNEILEFLIAL